MALIVMPSLLSKRPWARIRARCEASFFIVLSKSVRCCSVRGRTYLTLIALKIGVTCHIALELSREILYQKTFGRALKTTRRAAGSGLPRLFPRVLDDDRLDARLGIAIRFFETHLGRSRAELDAEALMTLFGDPRLARGLLRCLARSYRYCDRPMAEVLGTERAAALTARGQGTPRHLPAPAHRRANQAGGFVSPAKRADFLMHLVDDLELTEIEQVLWLDAPDQAVLVRHGPVPTAADIRACYNVQVLETLLSTAPESRFALRGNP